MNYKQYLLQSLANKLQNNKYLAEKPVLII